MSGIDVIVVGAGASGIPAAIAAARIGARVTLLEEDMVPGGAPVDMYVAMICGGPRLGIYREIIQRLDRSHTPAGSPSPTFGVDGEDDRNHWYLPSSWMSVAFELIGAEPNLRLAGGSRVVGVLGADHGARQRVVGVRVEGIDGATREFRAPVTIDATGTGIVAALAGAATMYGREARADFHEPYGPDHADLRVQRCTWMYVSQRLRPGAVFPYDRLQVPACVESELDHWVGKVPNDDWIGRSAGIYLHWGGTVQCRDTRDAVALAEAQRECFGVMKADRNTLRAAGFTVHLAPRMGVRECRRVRTDHVVTVNDLKSGVLPEDTVAVGRYGLDAWGESFTTTESALPLYGIPYRALLPADFDGLLVAGKAIGGTHLASSAYRVQPIVASIGQAAGTAAALAARRQCQPREVDRGELRRSLTAQGTLPKEALS